MKILAVDRDDVRMSNTGEDRPTGLHLSDVLKRMHFERDRKMNPNRPLDMMRIECGFTWEAILTRALAERHRKTEGQRPDPITVDGIICSPDWIVPGLARYEEWKATFASMRYPFEEKQWWWIPQIKAYAKATGYRICRLRIWYIEGDYSREVREKDLELLRHYKAFDLEFTQREIDENWRSIVSYAVQHGMLEGACPATENQTSRQLQASLKDRASKGFNPPPPSSKGKIVTFPSTRKSKTPPAGS